MKKLLSGIAVTVVVTIVAAPAGASSNDPFLVQQWNLDRIEAEAAWEKTTGTGAVVAVVDSGVDLGHPDLAANLLPAADADFVERGCNEAEPDASRCPRNGPQDELGHGTHVAGIIAAVANNEIGIAGVAPGAKLLPVRVLNEEGKGTGGVPAGIRYAADRGADVINLSWGYTAGAGEALGAMGDLDDVYGALDYAWDKGSLVVVAAGNDSSPLCSEPASHENVICVGATDESDLIATYSNYDGTGLDGYLVAPGGDGKAGYSLGPNSPTASMCDGDIISTYLRSLKSWCAQDGYESNSGTSMAAPHVSGVAALLASKGLTNAQIARCLFATADDLGPPGRDPIFGYGRVNALSAVTEC